FRLHPRGRGAPALGGVGDREEEAQLRQAVRGEHGPPHQHGLLLVLGVAAAHGWPLRRNRLMPLHHRRRSRRRYQPCASIAAAKSYHAAGGRKKGGGSLDAASRATRTSSVSSRIRPCMSATRARAASRSRWSCSYSALGTRTKPPPAPQ